MENRPHLNQVESVRAIAALMVAVFHFSAYFTWNSTLTEGFRFGAQGVEIFYIISGFIITYSLHHSSYSIKNYFRYLAKRLSRLIPPYLSTIILIQLIGISFCTYLWGCAYDIPFKQIIVNAFFLADLFPQFDWINPIFATLEVELHFYLVIGLMFPLFILNKWNLSIISSLLLALGIYTSNYDTFLVNSPYFIVGISLFYIKNKGAKIEYLIPLLVSFFTLLNFYVWTDALAALIGGGLIFFLPSNFRFLNFTGKISYSFYLVHGLSGGWLLYFFSPTEFAQNNPFLAILFALIFSWIIAFLMYYSVEKISLKISKRIKYRK